MTGKTMMMLFRWGIVCGLFVSSIGVMKYDLDRSLGGYQLCTVKSLVNQPPYYESSSAVNYLQSTDSRSDKAKIKYYSKMGYGYRELTQIQETKINRDIDPFEGSNVIYAPFSGVIKKLRYLPDSLLYLEIAHDTGETKRYHFLSSIGPEIKVGMRIAGGQYIGRARLKDDELWKIMNE